MVKVRCLRINAEASSDAARSLSHHVGMCLEHAFKELLGDLVTPCVKAFLTRQTATATPPPRWTETPCRFPLHPPPRPHRRRPRRQRRRNRRFHRCCILSPRRRRRRRRCCCCSGLPLPRLRHCSCPCAPSRQRRRWRPPRCPPRPRRPHRRRCRRRRRFTV